MDEYERAKYIMLAAGGAAILWGIFVAGQFLSGATVAILLLILYKLDLIDKRIQHSIAAEKTIARRLEGDDAPLQGDGEARTGVDTPRVEADQLR